MQIAILGCFTWAMIHGDENPAYNLYITWVVFEFITHLFIPFSKDLVKTCKEAGHTYGLVVDYFIDIVQIVGLAAMGWFWLVGFKIWSVCVTIYINNLIEKDKKKEGGK